MALFSVVWLLSLLGLLMGQEFALPSIQPTLLDMTANATLAPSAMQVQESTDIPTLSPSVMPTSVPTHFKTGAPSVLPTEAPSSSSPTISPTASPTVNPTWAPTEFPTSRPSSQPSSLPTVHLTSISASNSVLSPYGLSGSDVAGITAVCVFVSVMLMCICFRKKQRPSHNSFDEDEEEGHRDSQPLSVNPSSNSYRRPQPYRD